MPCIITDDEIRYYAETEHKEKLIRLITYTNDCVGRLTGSLDRFDIKELTNMLCQKCKEIEKNPASAEYILYNGRKVIARELADWWDVHKAFDAPQEKGK